MIFIGVEAIDDAMMIYISVTRVKELIDEVLKPVIKEAKKESEYTRVVKMKIDGNDQRVSDLKTECANMQR